MRVHDWSVTGEFHWDRFYWALAALGVAVGMLYRYLKFFKHYTSEMFVSYSELPEPTKPPEPPKPNGGLILP